MTGNKHSFEGAAFLVGIAIVVSAFVMSGAVKYVKKANDVISVTGSARKPISSDFAVWRGNISSQSSDLQSAYRDLKIYRSRLEKFFSESSIPEGLYSFGSINTWTMQEYNERGVQTGRILGYRLTLGFEIGSEDIDMVEGVFGKASDLIDEGVPVESRPIEYVVTRLADYRISMLAEATSDAKQRAEVIAESAGCDVGAVRNVKMGVFQVTRRNSIEVSDYGIYDTSTRDKDIMAVVRVSFAVEK